PALDRHRRQRSPPLPDRQPAHPRNRGARGRDPHRGARADHRAHRPQARPRIPRPGGGSMNLLLVLALGGLMHAARSFQDAGSIAGTTLAFGFVLLVAFFAGGLSAGVRLPKITGYMIAGIVVGPAVIGLLTPEMVRDLELVDGVAIAMIALTAGNELDLKAFRPLMRSIYWITLLAVVGTAVLLGITVLAMK